MKVLIGVVIVVVIEVLFVIFMYASGRNNKEIDRKILQNKIFDRVVLTNEKVLLAHVVDEIAEDEYCWTCIFINNNEIQLIKDNQLLASYPDKKTFFKDWRFVFDD